MSGVPGYAFERLLGRGGFSEVWLARRESDRALVAVKVVKNPEHARLLREEARALALVRGPGIVTTLAVELEAEPPFVVLEWARDGDLRRRIHEHGLPAPASAFRWVDQLLATLARVHRAGIVHGDLKPENVLFGSRQELLLADFGLSRRIAARTATLALSLSHADERIAGTIDYLAPEQRHGERPTPRSDVFAMGVLLHELLTGERPQGVGRSPCERRPELPPHVDRVLGRALATDPAERFADAAALRAALRLGRWVDGNAVRGALAQSTVRGVPAVLAPLLYGAWAVPYWVATAGKLDAWSMTRAQAAGAAAATLLPLLVMGVNGFLTTRAVEARVRQLRAQESIIIATAGIEPPRRPRTRSAWLRAWLASLLPPRARRFLLRRRRVRVRVRPKVPPT